MLDPIIDWFRNAWQLIVRMITRTVMLLLSPFIAVYNWFQRSGLIIRILLGCIIIPLVVAYIWFAWHA